MDYSPASLSSHLSVGGVVAFGTLSTGSTMLLFAILTVLFAATMIRRGFRPGVDATDAA